MKVCKEKRETVCPDYPKMCRLCGSYRELTNADRIRAMTDEELAEFWVEPFCDIRTNDECMGFQKDCKRCVLNWLKQPVKEGADHAD